MRFQSRFKASCCWCLAMAAVLAVAAPASAQVKISQVYGAGGNLLSPLANDYVELYNTGAPQDLTGWSLQYASATGTTWTVTALPSVVLGTGKYLLVRQANGGTIGDETAAVAIANQVPGLPAPDGTGTTAMAADAFKVALVSSTTALVGGTPTYAATPSLQDFIGCGTTASWNDASASGVAHTAANNAPPASVAHALYRLGCGSTDTDSSRADWAVGWPAPRNTATPENMGFSVIGTALPLTVEETQTVRLTASPYICGAALADMLCPLDETGIMCMPAGAACRVNNRNGTCVQGLRCRCDTGGLAVDTALIGGGVVTLLDDGVAPDEIAGDEVYTAVVTVAPGTAPGTKNLPITANDGGSLSGGSYISILVKGTATPDNDNCAGATALAVPSTTNSTFTDLTVESNGFATFFSAPTSGHSSRRGAWYTVVGTGNTMTASLCATTPALDTVIAVFCGPCDGLTVVATGDDGGPACAGSAGSASWCSSVGTTYTIWVARFTTTGVSTAPYTLDITDNATPCATAFPCPTCLGVSGPYTESEPAYGPHRNDGCGSTPNLFTDIASPTAGNTVIRGAARGMTGNRDIDSYRFQATANGVMTMTIDTLGANAQAQLNTLAAGGVCPQVSVVNTPVTIARCTTGTQTSVSAVITAGQWYVINVVGGIGMQVTAAGTVFGGQMPGGTTHQYTLTLNFGAAGACCRPDGSCAVLTEAACLALGAGAVFHPDEGCPPATPCAPGGACCLTDGSCSILIQSVCEANPNFYRWTEAAACTPNLCVGRCCHADGSCTTVIAPQCNQPGDVYAGDGTVCSVSGDECRGRCCEPDGTCALIGPADCVSPDTFGGLGTSCADLRTYGNPTPPTVSIPSSGAAPPSVINVPDNFLIQDVDVRVRIQHTWRSDINICLTGPGGSPTVALTASPTCITGGNCGSEDNYNAIYNDEGAAIVCASANLLNLAATPDQVIPGQSLAAFDGLSSFGDWTLAIVDDTGGDSGTLLEWALILDNGPACLGACCNGSSCTRVSAAACASGGGIYQGDTTSCSPSPCAPNGACCLDTGCSIQAQADCNTAGGVYGGDGSTCASPAPCQAPCCKPDGSCTLQTVASCNAITGAVAGTLGTPCPAPPCAPLGACCAGDGTCSGPVTEAACTASGGIRWTSGESCTPNPCQGRCCAPDGTCNVTLFNACLAPNIYGGDGTDCSNPDACLGRCCLANGTCSVTGPGDCAGTFTIGLNCSNTTVLTYPVSLFMQDPDAGGTPVSDVQIVSGFTGNITDLDVDVQATHTFPGDVTVTIEHLGTVVVIYDRPGVPATTFGCGTDNFDIILDDEGAGGPIETVCNAAAPSALSPPNFVPNNPLTAFDGMDPNGAWTITAADVEPVGTDVGTILRWSLHLSVSGDVCPVGCTCFGDMNGDTLVDGGDVSGFTQCVISGGGAGCACADMNHSGTVTPDDVAGFVAALLAGGCGP